MASSVPQTVFICGLPDKPSKEEMRRSLYQYCSQFGSVLEVHVLRNTTLWGQAFVVFPNVMMANECKRWMNGINFYNREIKVTLSHRLSFLADPRERQRRDAQRALQQVAGREDPTGISRKRTRDD